MPEVIHITCNIGTYYCSGMYALSTHACGSQGLGKHIRQIPCSHVINITIICLSVIVCVCVRACVCVSLFSAFSNVEVYTKCWSPPIWNISSDSWIWWGFTTKIVSDWTCWYLPWMEGTSIHIVHCYIKTHGHVLAAHS